VGLQEQLHPLLALRGQRNPLPGRSVRLRGRGHRRQSVGGVGEGQQTGRRREADPGRDVERLQRTEAAAPLIGVQPQDVRDLGRIAVAAQLGAGQGGIWGWRRDGFYSSAAFQGVRHSPNPSSLPA